MSDDTAQPMHEPTSDLTSEYPTYDTLEEQGPTWGAGRHQINVLHLVFGVAFLGMVITWVLIESGAVDGHGLRWLLPIPWVAAGAAGLIATAPRLRGTR
jgi:hypothetical protein